MIPVLQEWFGYLKIVECFEDEQLFGVLSNTGVYYAQPNNLLICFALILNLVFHIMI